MRALIRRTQDTDYTIGHISSSNLLGLICGNVSYPTSTPEARIGSILNWCNIVALTQKNKSAPLLVKAPVGRMSWSGKSQLSSGHLFHSRSKSPHSSARTEHLASNTEGKTWSGSNSLVGVRSYPSWKQPDGRGFKSLCG